MKTVYLIGGTMGVGKTSVSRELEQLLPNSVFLDGDWCWDSSPFQVTEETKAMVLGNISYLPNSFIRCSAYDNVIFCWVMHEQSIIDSIVSSLDTSDCEIKKLSLICDTETLRRRLQDDVECGIRTPDVIERSLLRMPLYERLNTVKVDTTGSSAREIARIISEI